MTDHAFGVLQLVRVAAEFATIDRATRLLDKITAESDTDHTVMLGLVACALARELNVSLDQGKIAQFALVHDLPEAIIGDTPTLRISSKALEEKAVREAEAMELLFQDLRHTPWVEQTLNDYEWQRTYEAQWVWSVDKLLPKLLAVLNGGAGMKEQGATKASLRYRYRQQREKVAERAPELLPLWDWSTAQCIDIVKE